MVQRIFNWPFVILMAGFFFTGAVPAESHPSHHMHGSAPTQLRVSPFEKTDMPVHCILNGHSEHNRCPHMNLAGPRSSGPRFGPECGGKTDSSRLTPDQSSHGVFTPLESLFPVQSISLSTSPEVYNTLTVSPILPPPRTA